MAIDDNTTYGLLGSQLKYMVAEIKGEEPEPTGNYGYVDYYTNVEIAHQATDQSGCQVNAIDESKWVTFCSNNSLNDASVSFELQDGIFVIPNWEDPSAEIRLSDNEMQSEAGITVDVLDSWGALRIEKTITVDKSGGESTIVFTKKSYLKNLVFSATGADSGVLNDNGDTLNSYAVRYVEIRGEYEGEIPDNFCAYCPNLEYVSGEADEYGRATAKITRIGNNFCYSCPLLTSIPQFASDYLEAIGNNFVSNCSTFNGVVSFPSISGSAKGYTIGTSFLSSCPMFNNGTENLLNLGNAVSIGDYFLYYDASFNRGMVLKVSALPNYFLASCTSFNSQINSYKSITSIGMSFLENCGAFNHSCLASTIFNQVEKIGANFLRNCRAYNQRINFPLLKALENNFMGSCSSYDYPLKFPLVISVGDGVFKACTALNSEVKLPLVSRIGSEFMRNCPKFNQNFDLSEYLSYIGTYFMHGCNDMTGTINVGSLDASITAPGSLNYTLSTTSSTAQCYVTGITIKGAARASWLTKFADRTSSPYRKLIDGNE